MSINLNRLRKEEILWLNNHYCRHHHTYLEHLSCYEKESPKNSPIEERIGILDIETTGLTATYGRMISYCIKEKGKKKIYGRTTTKKETLDGTFDKKLLQEMVKDLHNFDRIITYYGGDFHFDLPFVRTRCLKYDLVFPVYGEIKGFDLYGLIKKKFRFHSNRLAVVAPFFGIKAKGHPMTPEVWDDALIGKEWALKWVFVHNKEDVETTEKLYDKVINFSNRSNVSI